MQNHHETEEIHGPVGNESQSKRVNEMLRVLKTGGRNDVEVEELEEIIKVCDAERDSQKFISKTYSIRAPIGKIK